MATVVNINGKRFDFIGAAGDFYFENLETFHAQGDAPLLRYLRTIAPNAVSLDIGANIGLTALAISAFTPAGRVYAFEPSPNNLAYLRANVQANGSRVEVVGAAVGDGPGTVSLHLPPTGAHSSVIRSGAPDGPNVANVRMISIDDWMRDSRLDRVDFMKIDVEGFETNAVAGAAQTIVRMRPTILMEFNSVAISFSVRVSPLVFAEAFDRVFNLYDIGDDGELIPIGDRLIRNFVHENMVKHGCVDDIIMKVRDGVSAADIREAMDIGVAA